MTEESGDKNFDLYPLLLLAVAFALGIILESFFEVRIQGLLASMLGVSALAFIFRHSFTATILVAIAFFSLGAICFFVERSSVRDDRIRSLIDNGVMQSGDPVEIEGVIHGSPEPSVDGIVLTVAAENVVYKGEPSTASGMVRVYAVATDDEARVDLEDLDLTDGSRVAIACDLVREEQYQNPGVTSHIELLDRQAIDAIATLKSPLLIEKLDNRPSLFDRVYGIRQSLIEQFHNRFSSSTSGVLTASMLGDKYFLDRSTADIFREGGTFHVLVISGLHITFIGGILLFIVSSITRKPVIQFVVVTSALWAYTFAVGADVPVIRASIMFTILIFSRVIHRQGSLLNSFGACVIILLAWRPSDIFSPSFQLTVVSVASIVAIAFPLIKKLRSIGSWIPTAATPFPPNVPARLTRFCEMLYWQPTRWTIETSRQIWSGRIFKAPYLTGLVVKGGQRGAAYIVEGLLVSGIVQVCLLPFLIIYFHRVAPVSIFMNLWVGFVIAAESFSSLVAVSLSGISEFIAEPFISVTELLNYLLVSVPELFVRSEWASWRIPEYSGVMLAVYVLYFIPVILLAAVLWRWKPFAISHAGKSVSAFGLNTDLTTIAKMLGCAVLFSVLVVVCHPYSAPAADGRLHIDFLDVGQGDSVLVTFPDATTMLIDGGGRADFREPTDDDSRAAFEPDRPGIGESVVSPVLWHKGYSKIDYVVATHADADHMQGLTDVVANFAIGEALFGRMPSGDPEFAELATVLKRRNIPADFVRRGQILRFGNTMVEVLYPRADPSPDAPSDNNHSVVLRIVYGDRAFLLTGDIEQAAELDLVNGGGTLAADVIKVPHHGSRTSSTQEFIDAVHPEYSIISVGRHSRFGHPHREVVERWRDAGTNVLTTGERGMISVSSDGKDLVLEDFVSAKFICSDQDGNGKLPRLLCLFR